MVFISLVDHRMPFLFFFQLYPGMYSVIDFFFLGSARDAFPFPALAGFGSGVR